MKLNLKHQTSLNTIKTLYTDFYWLLKSSIIKSLRKSIPENIISKKNNFILHFLPDNIKFNITKVSETVTDTVQYISPKIQVILPFKIISLINRKSLMLKCILLELPKFDLQGTFVLKGLRRSIVSKLVKLPGIYFSQRKEGDVIVNRALIYYTSTKQFSIELTNEHIYIYINPEEKICLITLLHYLGLKNKDIVSISRYGNDLFIKNLLLNNYIEYKHIYTKHKHKNYIQILQKIKLELNLSSSNYRKYLFKNIKLPESLDKNQLCSRLGTYHSDNLLSLDLLLIIDILLDLKYKKRMPEDLDNLGNRKLESIGNAIQNQLEFSLKKLFNTICNNSKTDNFLEIINLFKNETNKNEALITIKELFYVNPLIQFLDQINSISELMHKIKVSIVEPGSKLIDTKGSIGLREIRPSILGKLCILDTNEGNSSGLIVSLSKHSRITSKGYIESFIKNSNIIKTKTESNFINAFEQENIQITFKPYKYRKAKVFNEFSTLALIKGEFKKINLNKNKLPLLLPLEEILSFTENMIPFALFNDPARCLMGARMQAQSVPLIYNQKPIVLTGSESSIINKTPLLLRSLQEGLITYVDSSIIVLRDIFNRKITYYIPNYKKNNQGIIMYQKPIVWPGERVNLGQLLTCSQDISESEFTIGNNLSVLYGTFFGYEFEDAIIINKEVINKHIFTSLHFDIYETTFYSNTTEGIEFSTSLIPKQSTFRKRNLDIFGFVKEGSKVLEGDILIGKIATGKFIRPDKAISTLIYTLFGTELRQIYDKSIRVNTGNSGRVVKVEIFTKTKNYTNKQGYMKCRVFVCKQRNLNVGDKLCGRHGNKGVLAYIAEPSDLPYSNNSFIPDIITSPLGVPSRMNLGQLFESILGFYGATSDVRILLNSSMTTGMEFTYIKNMLYRALISSKNKLGYSWLYNPYTPGKVNFRDGRNGSLLKGSALIGTSYYSKLIHMVKDKIHYRTIGPYAEITQQPIKGRANYGGQRFGEMEVWALEAYGASYNLRELLTYKSDDLVARANLQQNLINNVTLNSPTVTESFRLMLRELNGLTLNLNSFVLIDTLNGKKLDLNVAFN